MGAGVGAEESRQCTQLQWGSKDPFPGAPGRKARARFESTFFQSVRALGWWRWSRHPRWCGLGQSVWNLSRRASIRIKDRVEQPRGIGAPWNDPSFGSSPAEGLVHDLVRLGRASIGQAIGALLPGRGEDLQQVFERVEIAGDRRLERCLDAVVSWDDGGIRPPHSGRPSGRFDCFAGKACTPAAEPVVAGGTVTELRTDSVVRAFSRIAQGAEGVGEIGTGLAPSPVTGRR